MDIATIWMTRPAIVVSEHMKLPAARRLMRTQRIRRLPVINDAGQLVGIVSEGDIDRISDAPDTDVRTFDLYHTVRDVPLRDVMTRTVISVSPDTPIITVARLLCERRIGGVPVVGDGQVVGVITTSDLLRSIIAAATP